MNTPPHAAFPLTDRLLRQHERWMRLAWPLGILVVGLAATLGFEWRRHPSLARVEQWSNLGRWWAAGVALTVLAAGGVWLARRRAGLRGARRLDLRLDAKNRLETAAVLRGDAGAMAQAQREEAGEFLTRRRAAPSRGAPLLALGGLAAILALAHLGALLSWTRPWVRPAVAAVKPHPAPSPGALPPARIQWKTPASEIKASPIEEVPLQALATSAGGLRDLVLELSVNGQARLNLPVAADALKTAGAHPVQTSIYLDQLEVEPFDVVSYYLRAQRIDPRKLPETVSSVQFVQIKPFRDDVREVRGGEGNAGFALITALKVAQLRLIKENFVLAHTELNPADAEWKKANGHVGGEQAALEKKTGEAVQQLIEDGAPAEVVNLITQAKPFMGEAAQKIAAAANGPALTPQGKSLGLITEVEKLASKLAPHGGALHGQKPNVSDPFADKQQFEMKQRFKTSGGQLEMLAAAQAKLAEDLAKPDGASPADPAPDATKPPDPDKIEGTIGERQTQISQRVGALLNGRVFNPEITGHLEQGHDQARESLQRIDNGDSPAAREPAAAAARELQAAADAMNRVGEEQAKLQLADAQHTLNEAADQAREAARQQSDEAARERAEKAAEQARQTARDLAAQAQAQQDTGSAEAAKRLNDMARALSAPDVRNALEKLRAQPQDAAHAQAAADRLRQMAELAAQQRSPGPLSPEELAQLVERLERDRANLQRLASNAPDAKAGEPTSNHGQEPKSDGNEPAGQEKPGAQRRGDLPHPSTGQPSQGSKPGEGKPAQGKQPGEGKQGQGQQGQGQQGQKGPRPGEQGQGQGQPGQGQNPPSQGDGAGQQMAQRGTPSSQSGPPGEGGGESATQGQGRSPSSSRNARGQRGASAGHDSPDLGDTFARSVGDLQSGAPPITAKSSAKPTYTDHAPSAAQTRDPRETREEFARELVEDVREAAQSAVMVVPKAEALAEVRTALNDVPVELHYVDQAALVARIDPPLLGLIDSLHAAQQHARRDHQLTDGNLDLAPAAYRSAVADYFEQLSRDYDGAPPCSAGAEKRMTSAIEWQFGGWLRPLPAPVAWSVVGLLAIGGALFVTFLYRHTLRTLPPGARIPLTLLRAAIVLLVLLCLANPVRVERRPLEPSARDTLAVVIDRSDSMTAADHRGATRLTGATQLWKRHETEAQKAFPRTVYRHFAIDSATDPNLDHALQAKAPGAETHLYDALRQTLDLTPGAIVCLTDGLDTTGGSAEAFAGEAQRRGVPLYFALGANRALAGELMTIRTVKAPSQVLRQTEFTASALVEVSSRANRNCRSKSGAAPSGWRLRGSGRARDRTPCLGMYKSWRTRQGRCRWSSAPERARSSRLSPAPPRSSTA